MLSSPHQQECLKKAQDLGFAFFEKQIETQLKQNLKRFQKDPDLKHLSRRDAADLLYFFEVLISMKNAKEALLRLNDCDTSVREQAWKLLEKIGQ